MSTSLVPVRTLATEGSLAEKCFRLTLERIPGDRVQTGFIDVSGVQFKAWAKRSRVDEAIELLAIELARHLNITRSDVDVNEDTGIHGVRRFRILAHYLGKPKSSTDGVEAWKNWHASSARPQPALPDFIDV